VPLAEDHTPRVGQLQSSARSGARCLVALRVFTVLGLDMISIVLFSSVQTDRCRGILCSAGWIESAPHPQWRDRKARADVSCSVYVEHGAICVVYRQRW